MQQQGLAVTVSGITAQVESPGQSYVLPSAPESATNTSAIIAAVAGSLGSVIAITAIVCLALFILKRKNAKIDPSGLPVTYEAKSSTNIPVQKEREPPGSTGQRIRKKDTGAGAENRQQTLINAWSSDPPAPVVGPAESRVSKCSICICMRVWNTFFLCSTLILCSVSLQILAYKYTLVSVHVHMF